MIVSEIRSDSKSPGISNCEANFLRLLDAVTNGTVIEINETGTKVKFVPGVIVGGE